MIEDKAERKARVVARNAPQSVKKLQRVADLVRGMERALAELPAAVVGEAALQARKRIMMRRVRF